jgi:hypothetical protein
VGASLKVLLNGDFFDRMNRIDRIKK